MKNDVRQEESFYRLIFILLAIAEILNLVWLISIPHDSKNVFLWGFSKERLTLLFLQLALGVFSLYFAAKMWRDNSFRASIKMHYRSNERHYKTFKMIFLSLFFVTSTLILCPLYRFADYAAFFERLRPLVLFLMLMALYGYIILLELSRKQPRKIIKSNFLRNRSIFQIAGEIFAVCLVAWLLIAKTGVGVKGNWPLWNEVGIPLLAWQIWLGLWSVGAACSLMSTVKKRSTSSEFWKIIYLRRDGIASLIIFLLAFFLWSAAPTANQYFSPGPYPPNFEPYPYADAAKFDMQAQFALIGQGFANGDIGIDHIAYVAFLSVLHLLGGQDYAKIIKLQIFFFSIFPAILYYLGKILVNRKTGLFLAILAILHQYNAILGGVTINTSHAANLLTEFPTGILLAMLAYWLGKGLKPVEEKSISYAFPVGSILALLILLRLNTLVMPLFVFFILIISYRRNWRHWVVMILLITLVSSMVLAPIMIVHGQRTGNYLFFLEKPKWFFGDVANYLEDSQEEATASTLMARVVEQTKNSVPLSGIEFIEANSTSPRSKYADTFREIANYFIHNIVTSVLILPNSPIFHDFQHVVFQNLPYWNKLGEVWHGEMSFGESLGLALNLFILSLGIAACWKRWKWAGLVPLGIFFIYNFSTALVGTAGGRYITPVIWVVLLYFCIGILQVLDCFSLEQKNEKTSSVQYKNSPFPFRRGLMYFLPAVLFSVSIVILDRAFPLKYPAVEKAEVLATIQNKNLLARSNVSMKDLTEFLEETGSVAYEGMLLFPRYYQSGQGEHSSAKDVYQAKDFARLAYTIIGQFGTQEGILPLENAPSYFPDESDLIVIGCRHQEKGNNIYYIDTLLIILFDEEGNVIFYQREPSVGLSCENLLID